MTALQEEEEGDKAGDTQVEEALALWSLYTYTQQNYLLHLTHPWGVGEPSKKPQLVIVGSQPVLLW